MINKIVIEQTFCLEEAILKIFNLKMNGRLRILDKEAIVGKIAEEYDFLGENFRYDTYRKIADDFKQQTNCYGTNHPETSMNIGTILDVGCGSGLLCFELYEQTNGKIIGIDLSKDMIELANKNLKIKYGDEVKGIKEFWKNTSQQKKLKDSSTIVDRVMFVECSAYNIMDEFRDVADLNYIICRNTLHRFQYPEKAIMQMYNLLQPGGKIYIRDLKRDADWNTIVNRIGEKRWQTKYLVKDYLAAMASMLTINELQNTLINLGIKDFKIINGAYKTNNTQSTENLVEYEKDVEYVCIIKK